MSVTCAVCGKRVRVTKAGTLAKHGTYGHTCSASGTEQPRGKP